MLNNYYCTHQLNLTLHLSCARLNLKFNARSMRRGRSYWRRRNPSGMWLYFRAMFLFSFSNRNLESRLAAQGSQADF